MYEKIKTADDSFLAGAMKSFKRRSYYPNIPERKYKILYSGEGEVSVLEHQRAILLENAKKFDRLYPTDMWVTAEFHIDSDAPIVNFYTTLESLVIDNFHGTFMIECTTAGVVRILKNPFTVIRIMYMPPAGVLEYRKMKFNPVSHKKNRQNLYMLERLLLTKGYLFNPGRYFLDWSDISAYRQYMGNIGDTPASHKRGVQ